MARFEFTMTSDAMLQGLEEAGATGSETRAYLMLVRGLPKDRSKTECWMPADMAEVKAGMRPDVFSRALRCLCEKMVMASDGELVPILTKVSRGCRGHCPHYEDTLGQIIASGRYPADNARQNGQAINDPIARQIQDPFDEFSTMNCKAKTTQLQGKNDPIARQDCNPIDTRQDKHLVADALLQAAELSIGVTQPDKRETSERLQVGTGADPQRADGAAPEGRATALPSWAEVLAVGCREPERPSEPTPADEARYFELLRKLQDHMAQGGSYDEALTPDEREEFNQISARRRAHTFA